MILLLFGYFFLMLDTVFYGVGLEISCILISDSRFCDWRRVMLHRPSQIGFFFVGGGGWCCEGWANGLVADG